MIALLMMVGVGVVTACIHLTLIDLSKRWYTWRDLIDAAIGANLGAGALGLIAGGAFAHVGRVDGVVFAAAFAAAGAAFAVGVIAWVKR